MVKKKCIEDWHSIEPGRVGLLRAESMRNWDGCMVITVTHHPIVKYTPCGAWISTWGHERFVNLRAGKQYASVAEGEAIDQLKYRKRCQIRILTSRLLDAKEALALIEGGNIEPGQDLFFRNYKD